MSPKRPSEKTLKDKATRLHSLVVRARGACEKCGDTNPATLQCAHIISRARIHTRTDERNAFCLCAKDHWFFTNNPVEFGLFVLDRIGEDAYQGLREKANTPPPKPLWAFWMGECERLAQRLEEAA